MKFRLFSLPAVAVLAAGLTFAQSAPAPAEPSQPAAGQKHGGRMFQDLNLTDAQKQQAKSIFQGAREASQPLRQQLRDARQALDAAAKSGASDAQIDQLSAPLGPLTSQLTAIHTKAFAKFYALLTPEQRTQLAAKMEQHRGRGMNRHGNFGQGG